MSAFYRLPVELLTIIAQCVTEEEEWFEGVKALRLTHPCFANLDHLNAYLFQNITFHATPEGIDRVRAHPLTALRSFVRKVTFLPSPYSTGMTFFHFRRIVIKQCLWYCPADCGVTVHFSRRDGTNEIRLEAVWASEPLFTPEELLASSREYQRQALAAQALLTDGSLSVWTDALRQFSNVKAFEYGKLRKQNPTAGRSGPLANPWDEVRTYNDEGVMEWEGHSAALPTLPVLHNTYPYKHIFGERDCRVHPDHPHDSPWHTYENRPYGEPYHPASVCQHNEIRTQTGLIEPISGFINAAGVRPESLTLSSALTVFEPENPLPPNFHSLDLSHLRSLEWRTEIFQDGTNRPAPANERNAFLTALLQKCHLTLQDLRLSRDDTLAEYVAPDIIQPLWPPEKADYKLLPLPNLRQLYLAGSVDRRQLSQWINSMPRLELLTLQHGPGVFKNHMWNRRLARKAMRNHPSLLQVRLGLVSDDPSDGRKAPVVVRTFMRDSPSRSERKPKVGFGVRGETEFDFENDGHVLYRWLEEMDATVSH
jgi:hypothetical protein